MKRKLISLFLACGFCCGIFPQNVESSVSEILEESSAEENSDSAEFENAAEIENPENGGEITFNSEKIEKSWSEKEHFFIGLTSAMTFNLILSTWNRFVIGSEWAQTGPDDWNQFWKRPLEWDTDWYWTNFFLHPYQGALYYMAARGANLSPLKSFVITFLGSYVWEFLGEKNAPSKNDMVYTTVGSFCVGEMFFRLSQEINSDNRFFGIALNPQRLLTEHVFRIKQKNTRGNIQSMAVGFNVGTFFGRTALAANSEFDYRENEFYPVLSQLTFDVEYNDPYTHDSNTPYSQFSMDVKIGAGVGSEHKSYCAYEDLESKISYDFKILTDGMLLSRRLFLGDNIDTSWGLTMIYDFNWHSYYMLSSLAPGVAFKQRVNFEKSVFEYQAQAGFNLLGTTEYTYFHRRLVPIPDGGIRVYSYTIGPELLLKAKFAFDSRNTLNFNFRGYGMYDFKGQVQDGTSTGWNFIALLNASYEFALSEKVRLGVSDEIYAKIADSKNTPNVYKFANSAKIFTRLCLK